MLDKTDNLFVIRISGNTDAKTVADAYASAFQQADYDPEMSAMWDICDTRLAHFSMTEVRELTRLVGQHSKQRGKDYKVAIATNTKSDYHLLKIYSTFFRLAGSFRMKVFSDPQSAREWIIREN